MDLQLTAWWVSCWMGGWVCGWMDGWMGGHKTVTVIDCRYIPDRADVWRAAWIFQVIKPPMTNREMDRP
jgi:hypothetical protein